MSGTATGPGSVCFVEAALGGAGTVGTAPGSWPTAALLARRDWDVHVLAGEGGREDAAVAAALDAAGASVHRVAELVPGSAGLQRYGGDDPGLVFGEDALDALELFGAEHDFGLVVFGDRGAPAMRAVQAKRSGDALAAVPIAVDLGGPSFWRRGLDLREREGPRDLKLDYCERYAFDHADVQLAGSRYLLDQVRGAEWSLRDDALVVPQLPRPGAADAGAGEVEAGEIEELVFLGPPSGPGFDLFMAALPLTESRPPVLFLVSEEATAIEEGTAAIAAGLGDRPHRVEAGLDAVAARAELLRGGRLAVLPPPSGAFDTSAALAECAAARIPFLAARAADVPAALESLAEPERWLFDPTPADLAAAIDRRLAATGGGDLEDAAAALGEGGEEAVEAAYASLLARPPHRPVAPATTTPPSVTLTIAHFNHDRYLPGTLASIAAQTRRVEEVIVIDDGSTSAAARRVFAEQEALYPDWTFIRQENAGPGSARNRGLELAAGAYFLPFDSDNIAAPTMIERLVAAMEANPARAATSCHNLGFVEDADIAAGKFASRYSPTGGPRVLGCVENVFGDTCSIFRTEALRAVGGFEINRWSPTEDWETFVKIAMAGLEVDVLPRPLFYYRTDSGGRLQAFGNLRATNLRLREHLVERFCADARLTRRERRDLFECLGAFDWYGTDRVAQRLDEQRRWHEAQIADLDAFREAQVADQGDFLRAQIDAQRQRAEAAERGLGEAQGQLEATRRELAALAESLPKRLRRELARRRAR